MSFNLIGIHTNYDDPTSILDPQIIQRASEIKTERFEFNIWNRLNAPDQAITQESYKIGARTRTGLTGVIGDGAGTGWDNAATTNLPMTADAVKAVVIGSIMELYTVTTAAREIVVVKAVDRSANTIDVFERGAGSTSAAVWADAATFRVIGNSINDTDLKNVESRSEKTYAYENYLTLLAEPIEATYTDLNEARKYFRNQGQALFNEALDRVFRQMSSSLLNGVKVAGSKTKPAQAAGIRDQLQDTSGGTRDVLNVNVNGALTKIKLDAALESVFTKGSARTIYTSYTNAKTIMGFTINTQVSFNAGIPDARIANIGNSAIPTAYEYNGQLFDVVIDKDMPESNIFIVNEDKLSRAFKSGDALRFVPEPSQSSRESRWSFQGKIGFIVDDVGYEHIDLYGITHA